MRGRSAGWMALLLGAVALLVLLARPGAGSDRPLDPRSTGPTGAKAVVDLLEELGAEVDISSRPGSVDTALVLEDRLGDEGRAAAVDFVQDGGVLVLADPGSPIPALAGTAGAPRARCPAALAGVAVLRYAPGPTAEIPNRPGCFDGVVRVSPVGEGTLVEISSSRFFTNDLLDEADNAVLAAALLAPTGGERIAFLRGTAGSGEVGLADLVSPSVAQAIVQLAVAAVAYILWRGRRLGRPVAERQPVRVAGSELVAAVGRLLGGRRRPGEAAAALRAEVRRQLAVQVGVPPSAPVEQLAAAVAGRTGLDVARVAAALEWRPVTTDDDLVALTADLDRIASLVLQPTEGTRP